MIQLSEVVAASLLGKPPLVTGHDENGMFIKCDSIVFHTSGVAEFMYQGHSLAVHKLPPLKDTDTVTITDLEVRLRVTLHL